MDSSKQCRYSIAMSDTLPPCTECASAFTYQVDALLNCPECGHEWSAEDSAGAIVRDAVGNPLQDGDTVTVIKDLKVKGSSLNLKRGTVMKNIRLTYDEGEVECRHGKSTIVLKTCFLKKV